MVHVTESVSPLSRLADENVSSKHIVPDETAVNTAPACADCVPVAVKV
jgi:hypothetical protein